MDKLKPILKQLQKHHFWLLCILAMVVGLLGWVMARKNLSAAYDAKKTKITGAFKSLSGIKSPQNNPNGHPNKDWTDAVGKLTEEEKGKVRVAWETVYNDQQKVLTWPDFGPAFNKYMKDHPRPTDDIPRDLLATYQNLIRGEFPKLVKLAEAQMHNAGKARAEAVADGKAPPKTEAEEEPPRVVWDTGSQLEIQKSFEFQQLPTAAEVRQAQEDLWVYTALLKVIRAVNDTNRFVPTVKQISTLSIGRPAAESYLAGMRGEHVVHLQPAASSSPADAAATVQVTPTGDPTQANVAKPIDEGRYVEADGKALAAGTANQQQFKRLPVELMLVIDQREITKLLVELANSPLPVEIKQMRISAKKSSGPTPTSGASSADDGGRSGASRQGGAAAVGDSYSVPIELHGIISIYNPPDVKLLGAAPGAGAPAAGVPGAAGPGAAAGTPAPGVTPLPPGTPGS